MVSRLSTVDFFFSPRLTVHVRKVVSRLYQELSTKYQVQSTSRDSWSEKDYSAFYFVKLIVLGFAGRLREMILRIPVSPSLPAVAGMRIVFLFL